MDSYVTFEILPNGNVRVRWDGLWRRMFADFDPDPHRALTAMESAKSWVIDVLGKDISDNSMIIQAGIAPDGSVST